MTHFFQKAEKKELTDVTINATIFKQARIVLSCSFVKDFFTDISGVVRSFLGRLRLFAFLRKVRKRGCVHLE